MFKKYLIIIIIIIKCSIYGQENNCTILETIGEVKINNIKVKRGNIFSENDSIIFSVANGGIKSRCLNPLRIKSISGKNFKLSKAKTLKEYWHNLGTRSSTKFNIKDWDSFKYSKKIGIINELKIPLDYRFKSIIKDTTNYGFFVRYYIGNKKIEKEIPFKDWTLKITKNLFKNGNKFIKIEQLSTPILIYLYSKKEEASTRIGPRFNPIFINVNKLKSELFSILNDSNFQKIDKRMIVKEYLTLNYPSTNFSINALGQILDE